MSKTITALAILSAAIAVTAGIAMAFPQAAFAQQASVGVGSTNGGTVGAASSGTSSGTTAAASGGPTSTQCISGITFVAAGSICLSQ